jgi:hypothetical protein
VIDRLRFLLDRPLDPAPARAVVVFATAVLVGFVAVFVLGASSSDPPAPADPEAVAGQPHLGRSFGDIEVEAPSAAPPTSRRPGQDPQDKTGSPAAGRAAKAMRSHRALQHVPYRSARFSVELTGAHGGRAVLAVRAPTISEARRGWRGFLRRYRDGGRAYLPRFEAAAKAAGGGG